MSGIQKTLIVIGLILVFIGFSWPFLTQFLRLGRLPGDIAYEKENFRFYFPVTSSIIVSILLTLAMAFIGWLTKK